MKKIISFLFVPTFLFAFAACADNVEEEKGDIGTTTRFTENTSISDVINDPVFGDFGRMIFPFNSGYYGGSTLGNLRLTWHNNKPQLAGTAYFMRETESGGMRQPVRKGLGEDK